MNIELYQFRTLKSELGCWPVFWCPYTSSSLLWFLHLTGHKYFAASRNSALTKSTKIGQFGLGKELNKPKSVHQEGPAGFAVSCPRGASMWPFSWDVQGEPRVFLHCQRTCDYLHCQYVAAYQWGSKSNFMSSFLQPVLLQIFAFQWRQPLFFPGHSIAVTSDTQSHFDKCPVCREMNFHEGEFFFPLFFLLLKKKTLE